MTGIVTEVHRDEYFINDLSSMVTGHNSRYTNTWAVLDNGDKVLIDEDDIREYYDRTRITESLIDKLRNDLEGVEIEYYEEDDGDYYLDGNLDDYI